MNKLTWRNQLNAILGLLVIIIPWLGLPRTMIAVILTIIGLLIFIFSAVGSKEWNKRLKMPSFNKIMNTEKDVKRDDEDEIQNSNIGDLEKKNESTGEKNESEQN